MGTSAIGSQIFCQSKSTSHVSKGHSKVISSCSTRTGFVKIDAVFLSWTFTHWCPMFAFYTPWKHRKTVGFLFSGDIKREQQAVMV